MDRPRRGTQTSKPREVEGKAAMQEAVPTPTEVESQGPASERGLWAAQQVQILGISCYECFKCGFRSYSGSVRPADQEVTATAKPKRGATQFLRGGGSKPCCAGPLPVKRQRGPGDNVGDRLDVVSEREQARQRQQVEGWLV